MAIRVWVLRDIRAGVGNRSPSRKYHGFGSVTSISSWSSPLPKSLRIYTNRILQGQNTFMLQTVQHQPWNKYIYNEYTQADEKKTFLTWKLSCTHFLHLSCRFLSVLKLINLRNMVYEGEYLQERFFWKFNYFTFHIHYEIYFMISNLKAIEIKWLRFYSYNVRSQTDRNECLEKNDRYTFIIN